MNYYFTKIRISAKQIYLKFIIFNRKRLKLKMEYVTSLWDPLCIGDRMFLFLTKNAMKKEKIPSEQLIYESEFMEFKNLGKSEKVIL